LLHHFHYGRLAVQLRVGDHQRGVPMCNASSCLTGSPMRPSFLQSLVELAKAPLPHAVHGRRTSFVASGVGIAWILLSSCLYGVTVARFATNNGELVVELDDPAIEVSATPNGIVVRDSTTQREFELGAADGEVEVFEEESGLKLATREFTLTRDGKTYLKVTHGMPANARPSRSDAQREVAEWVVSIQGDVSVRQGGNRQDYGANLPVGDFQVVGIRLVDNAQIGDAELAKLTPLANLEQLMLNSTRVADAGLTHLMPLKNLRFLLLSDTKVGDTGIETLAGLTNIDVIALDGTQVSDAGLSFLKAFSHLRSLDLSRTAVSDAGLEHLKTLTKLFYLKLNDTRVGDAGLEELKSNLELGGLHLNGTQVSDAGLAHLKPLTHIYDLQLGQTAIGDSGLKHLSGLSLQYLDLQGTHVRDGGLRHLATLTALGLLKLSGTKVGDAGLAHVKTLKKLAVLELDDTDVTDAGLEHLFGLRELRTLTLRGTQVTAEGVGALQMALPECHVTFGPK
jgi:Leucine-rich repeat (LRR) protein